MSTQESPLFRIIFVRSWWVFLFTVFCVFSYDRAIGYIELERDRLIAQANALDERKSAALIQQKKLQMQLKSTSDYNWIELTLMKGLGVVPEGSIKVYFEKGAYTEF